MNFRQKEIRDVFTKLGKMGFTVWFSGKERVGEYKLWWASGKVNEHGFYKNDKFEGEYKYWNDSGKLLRHHIYKDGRKIKDLK